MLNSIVVQGRFTKDPELRKTNSGKDVCSFTLACDNGNRGTDFIGCVAWGQTATTISRYMDKGSMAVVEGSLHSRKWEDKNGNKRVEWEITVNAIHFCEKRGTEYVEIEEDGELPY